MHPNEDLITRFYTCFSQRDAAGMIACYHPEILFSDPVFQNLKGERAGAMWTMLTGRSKDIEIIFRDVHADDRSGTAHWDAYYTYSATGKKVHNSVDAHFLFQDGKIIQHRDVFDLWKWASQALGSSGRLLGWTPFMQNTIRKRAQATLDTYLAKREKV